MKTLTLRKINHGKGHRNEWCGPAAISILTGMATGAAAAMLRRITGKTSIKGTPIWAIKSALGECGILAEPRSVRRGQTLKTWVDGRDRTATYALVAGEHLRLLQGSRYACGITGGPVGLRSIPSPRSHMSNAWELTLVRDVDIPNLDASYSLCSARRKSSGELAKAKRLAKVHGVNLENEGGRGDFKYYVSHPKLGGEGVDPFYGDHYAFDAHDVLERVKAYVEALSGKS